MFRKAALLEISRSYFLTGVAGLQPTVCNASVNEFLTKLLKGALKFTENSLEVISNLFPFQ